MLFTDGKNVNQDYSVALIVPCFNEEDSVALFVTEAEKALAAYMQHIFIVFVDDGSTDDTVKNILALRQDKPFINVLRLSRNFGKEAAVSAALDTVDADAYIIADVDLQDPLELAAQFIDIWREQGVDAVCGKRANRASDTWLKRVTAGGFYRVFNRLSGRVKIPVNVGDYRLIDRKIVEILRNVPEANRFMKGLFVWGGGRMVELPYIRPERAVGQTKWNYGRLFNFALDGITQFSSLPLRVWSYVGGCVALLAFMYMLFIIFRTLFLGIDSPGYASLMSAVLFLGGVQLVSIGVLGEYLGRMQQEIKRRPSYVVDGIVGQIKEKIVPGRYNCGIVLKGADEA